MTKFSRSFQNSQNQKPQTYCESTLKNIAITTYIILGHKIAFLVIFYFKIRIILKGQETPKKMRFYEQVWCVWWLRYSQKLTCNKYEDSEFWNSEEIFEPMDGFDRCPWDLFVCLGVKQSFWNSKFHFVYDVTFVIFTFLEKIIQKRQ